MAPDKFKGTLTAVEAARAIATGWRRARPADEVEEVPMADGGEGTLDALVGALGGRRYSAEVTGPLGEAVRADYGIAPGADGTIAIVEMARASGLDLLEEDRRDPRRTTTRGTGELILAAAAHGPSNMVVCIGGSATNDGGAGMAQALGIRLSGADGTEIGAGGEALLDLASIDMRGLDPALAGVGFLVACDVDNPLCGPEGASAVYGPQKGATPEDVAVLDHALGHYAAVLHRDIGLDIRDVPGAGAAGGLGASLIAFLGARLRPGIEVVMEAVNLGDRVVDADVVITGEGSFDGQSLHGKTTFGVVSAAREAGSEVAILCGRAEASLPDIEVRSLVDAYGEERAMGDTRLALEDLAENLADALAGGPTVSRA